MIGAYSARHSTSVELCSDPRCLSGASAEPANTEDLNTGYELFILVLTVVSLILLALSLMPFNEAVQQLLLVYQNSLCDIFLIDFAANLHRAPTWRAYVRAARRAGRVAPTARAPGPTDTIRGLSPTRSGVCTRPAQGRETTISVN